jgi:co-chaperonin GroES (HSP10)
MKDDEVVVGKEFLDKVEFFDRQAAIEKSQESSLRRDCFLTPFVSNGLIGRLIVQRDDASETKTESRLVIPKSLRKERTLLPTTGHVIKATVFGEAGANHSDEFIGLRVLFGQMSGTAVCFKQYPTWIILDLAEILAIVHKEESELEETTLEPMV